jgi:hypothetical protein
MMPPGPGPATLPARAPGSGVTPKGFLRQPVLTMQVSASAQTKSLKLILAFIFFLSVLR